MTVVPVRQWEVTAGHPPASQVNDDQQVTVAGNTKATAPPRRRHGDRGDPAAEGLDELRPRHAPIADAW